MRFVCLDTETTGVNFKEGHKVIEIGCIEVIDNKKGETYQQYLNPERKIDEGAIRVHGITNDIVKNEPIFKDVAKKFIDFIEGSTLVIHNASFDISFLNGELIHAGLPTISNKVLDTLAVARRMYPGQPASLDALCKRFNVESGHRVKHGALLDATLLADVFVHLGVTEMEQNEMNRYDIEKNQAKRNINDFPQRSFPPSAYEIKLHEEIMAKFK